MPPSPAGWRNKKKESVPSDDDETAGGYGKVADVLTEIDRSKKSVSLAIDKTLERGDKLDDLEDKSGLMVEQAEVFQREATVVERHFWWQNMKTKLLYGLVILAVGALIFFVAILPIIGT